MNVLIYVSVEKAFKYRGKIKTRYCYLVKYILVARGGIEPSTFRV